jgi:hypothetical protein
MLGIQITIPVRYTKTERGLSDLGEVLQNVDVPIVQEYVSIHDDPLAYFFSLHRPETQHTLKTRTKMFFAWLNQREGWAGVGPKELLIRGLQAEDQYLIPDLIQEYLDTHSDLRHNTLDTTVMVMLQFFKRNHCPLPPEVKRSWFSIHSATPPVPNRLTVEVIRNVIGRCSPRWRSLYLVKYQSLLDTTRLYWVSQHSADQITRQLNEGRDIIRVDIPCGRKTKAGDMRGSYFTYFGRDAASALTQYFNEERGWPKAGEPIWTYNQNDFEKNNWLHCKDRKVGDALSINSMSSKWGRLTRKSHYMPWKRDSTVGIAARYGYSLHDFRDLAVTELHIHAKSQGLDMDCVKFWCGHIGQLCLYRSRLLSDRLYRNQEYMEKQYKIAEPHLNIITETPPNHKPQDLLGQRPCYSVTYSMSGQC